MKKENLKYFIALTILLQTFDLNAQINEMVKNNNQIDTDFVLTSELKSNLNFQNDTTNEISLILEKSNDSLHSIYVINNKNDSQNIRKQDWHLYLIQEAIDTDGEWSPIEYWQYSSCGNSYLSDKIDSDQILKVKSIAYNGNYKTLIRFKLLHMNKVYYSNSIDGFIDLNQFSIPRNISEDRIYRIVETVGGFELAERVIFLEPNAMKEFGEKQERYLEKNKN